MLNVVLCWIFLRCCFECCYRRSDFCLDVGSYKTVAFAIETLKNAQKAEEDGTLFSPLHSTSDAQSEPRRERTKKEGSEARWSIARDAVLCGTEQRAAGAWVEVSVT